MADQVRQASRVGLVICSLDLGGAERQTVWLAEALADIGHQVSIINWCDTNRDHFAVPPGVARIALPSSPPARALPGKVTGYLNHVLQIRHEIRRGGYDVVVAVMPAAAVWTVMAAQGTPTRVVVSERSAPWMRRIHPTMKVLRRLTYPLANAQVAQTQLIADWLQTHAGCRNVYVVPNAVRNPLPSMRPEVDPSTIRRAGRRILLAVGTKPWAKGFDLLIDAFAQLADDFPEWDLAIAGLAPRRSERGLATEDIVAMASARGVGGRVNFPGVVGNMADWYAAADVFVLSSRHEGFPNVLGEALAAGLPCVAFDCPTGPADLLDGGRDGILVKDMTSEALAEALAQTMSDEQLREHLRERAAIATARYTPERVLAKWCEVLKVAPNPL